jgi:hypothetical protein
MESLIGGWIGDAYGKCLRISERRKSLFSVAPQCVTTLSKLQLPGSILRISPQKNVHFCVGRADRLFRILGICLVVPDFIDLSVGEMHRNSHTVFKKQDGVLFDLHRIPIPCFTLPQCLADSTLGVPGQCQ